ncbi:MAG: GNAT family N-acetyltransferase [Anaerolineales bacterium]|nr:GNAT family N-acetyltransferase [Anaerolineales bacterium]
MEYHIQCITKEHANIIANSHYDAPYSIYNLSTEAIPQLLRPENRYYVVQNENAELVGYCCYGDEAKVPGGDYPGDEVEILDIGVGMHPQWTGKGYGSDFVRAVLQFGILRFTPNKFRVTIAAFNQRSQRVFHKLGFKESNRFEREYDGLQFVQLELSDHNRFSPVQ